MLHRYTDYVSRSASELRCQQLEEYPGKAPLYPTLLIRPFLGVCTQALLLFSSTQGWADDTKKPETSPQDARCEGPGMAPLTPALVLSRGSSLVTQRTETLPVLIPR